MSALTKFKCMTNMPTLLHFNNVNPRGGSRAAATSKMEHLNALSRQLLSQSAPSWMLQQP